MGIRKCEFLGCGREAYSRGFCRRHYEIVRREEAGGCKVEGCDERVVTTGLCSKHSMEERRAKMPGGGICSEPGCSGGVVVVKDLLCMKHYREKRKAEKQLRQIRENRKDLS